VIVNPPADAGGTDKRRSIERDLGREQSSPRSGRHISSPQRKLWVYRIELKTELAKRAA